jgi:hypothetical protein
LNQEKGGDGVKIVERIPEHYEVQEVEEDLARTYRWCPEQVVLECGACGTRMTLKRSTLIASIVTCECGARTTASVREELSVELASEDEVVHPWRYWPSREEAGIPV